MNDSNVVENTTAVTCHNGNAAALVPRNNYDIYLDYTSFEDAQRRAKSLANSGLIPDRYRGDRNIGTVLQALNLAKKLNADILAVFQNVYNVKGQIGMSGKFIHALINNCGLFTTLDIEFEKDIKDMNVISCTVSATDLRLNKDRKMTLTWREVQAAGWDQNKKSRDGELVVSPWNKYRQLMFVYRTVSYFAKAYAPDVIMGMQSVEELQDIARVTGRTTPSLRPSKRTTIKDVDADIIDATPTMHEAGTTSPHEFDPPPPYDESVPYADEPDFIPDEPQENNYPQEEQEEGVTCWWDDMKHWQYRKPIDFYLLVMIGFGIAYRKHVIKLFNYQGEEIDTHELTEADYAQYQKMSRDNPEAILSLPNASDEIYERVKKKFVYNSGFDENVFIDFENS